MQGRYCRITALVLCCAGLLASLCESVTVEEDNKLLTAGSKIPVQVYSFSLKQVRLLDGPFKHAQEKDAEWLLKLEPDRFLSWFRKEAGLEPKGEVYGGWESQGIAGHSLGHYLSACSMMYATSGDKRFREKIDYIVEELALCQEKNGDGYLAAIPEGKRVFAEVVQGQIRSKGFDLNGVWVPWYTMHKVMAGLRDAYLLADNEKAREILIKMADWACAIVDKLTDEQIQLMLNCEHGGMNEIAADVYAITGDEKYLTLAKKFRHKPVLDPLSEGVDCLPGLHSNTQVPKLIGCARIYELTGEKYFHDAAFFYWDTIVNNHSYVMGGNSEGEYLSGPGKLAGRLSDRTAETCNTYNMLKLTRHLFTWEPDSKYADFYERALYNHILASQNPEDGMVCYFVPLAQGAIKTYSGPFDSFWCCVGTGMENHVKYAEGIYYHGKESLYVNLFIPSEVDWAQKDVTVRQETNFPQSNKSTLTIKSRGAVKFIVYIRQPIWAEKLLEVKVNGEIQKVGKEANGYIKVERLWRDGDKIEIGIPFGLRAESMPDDANRIAILDGPVVLAGRFGTQKPQPGIPVLITEGKDVSEWVRPTEGKSLEFETVNVGRPNDFSLIPFYKMHGEYYSVYFDIFTEQQWQVRQAEYEQKLRQQRELEQRTVDVMRLGEMQPERDHNFDGEKTRTGEHGGRKWRDAYEGGWFAFDVKVSPEEPVDIICTYWGGDGGGREFDILVDGKKLATQVLNNDKPGEFFDVVYAVPEDLTKGKDKVRVRFQAHPDRLAGGVFGFRVVKRK